MHTDIDTNRLNKYRGQWEFARGDHAVASTPSDLQLGRSNTCNFKCVYCVDHRTGNTKPRTQLSPEVWRDLSGLIPQTETLAFHGISEFFIDPDFFTILQSCADAKATIRLNTNGSVCTPRHLEALENYPGRLVIDFSLDAATPDTFTRIRGWDFWRVTRNIQKLVQAFSRRKASTWSAISFVIVKSNVHEMVPMVYFAKCLGVDVLTFYRLHEYEGLDWTVETRHGGSFAYPEETTTNFVEAYNREIERARRIADIIGMRVEIPGIYTEAEALEKAQ